MLIIMIFNMLMHIAHNHSPSFWEATYSIVIICPNPHDKLTKSVIS